METLSFEELTKIEPRLQDLLEQALSVSSRNPKFCANKIWYHELKPQLVKLVGLTAQNPDKRLHTSYAYDLAYHTIYNALPNCRHHDNSCPPLLFGLPIR
jgi:hypothetical protein